MKHRLADLTSLRSGYQFRGGLKDETPDGKLVRVIQIKDVEDGRLVLDDIQSARPRKQVEAYEVAQGDVLLLGRGRRFGASLVDVPVENTIAAHFFWILRPLPFRPHRESINPAYLTWLLNHPATQTELMAHAHTTHIPVISKSVIEELQIDVPPLETQNQIARLDELNRREQHLAQQLTELRAQWMDALTLQLARQDS